MDDQIAAALLRRFEEHRIVFWEDPEGEWAERVAALDLPGVVLARVANDEFGLKYRMLRGEPDARFLVYQAGLRPAPAEDWLLDVRLWAGAFRADRAAMRAAELGVPAGLEGVLADHAEVVGSRRRGQALTRRLSASETADTLRLKLLAVAAGAEGGLDTVVEALLAERAAGRDESVRLIERAGLSPFLWDALERRFGYRSEAPGIGDLSVALFHASWRASLGEVPGLNGEALLFFDRWRDSRTAADAFAASSADAAHALAIEETVTRIPLDRLARVFAFAEADQQVIRLLAAEVAGRKRPVTEIAELIRARRRSHWWDRYEHLYEAIGFGAEFVDVLASVQLDMHGLAEGVRRYAGSWFRVDQLYRRFTAAAQRSGLTGPLADQVEQLYVDSFLFKLGERWQAQVDASPEWVAGDVPLQRRFFVDQVGAYRQKEQRVCVIVSDALRYEVADELAAAIRGLDKFEATLEPMLGVLPSYTQLGMAALLPHRSLEIVGADATVLADGRPTAGLENRRAILATGRAGDRTAALKAEELMGLNKEALRTLVRDHDVLYVYHDRIDAIGDKAATEAQTFEACADAVADIARIVRKLVNANATHLLVTADHGFLFQQRVVGEGDYLSEAPAGEAILFQNRRFVLGRGLRESHGLRHFSAGALRLGGEVEALVPRSINRLRRQGAGSRFVHGGATLQEVVVPLLRIAKKRQSDVGVVDVEIIGLAGRTITTSQLAVTFYQTEPVTDKKRGRHVRAGLWSLDGTALSHEVPLTFDMEDPEPRRRETGVSFRLGREADAYDGQELELRLEERHGDTSVWRPYRSVRFRLRRSIENDFDF